ncbi:hypothetical protein PJP10_16525 [Mycobacterium kansasii]
MKRHDRRHPISPAPRVGAVRGAAHTPPLTLLVRQRRPPCRQFADVLRHVTGHGRVGTGTRPTATELLPASWPAT